MNVFSQKIKDHSTDKQKLFKNLENVQNSKNSKIATKKLLNFKKKDNQNQNLLKP